MAVNRCAWPRNCFLGSIAFTIAVSDQCAALPKAKRQTLLHKIDSDTLGRRLKLEKMEYYISLRKLRWAIHLARMPLTRLPRQFLTSWVNHPRPHGRPQYTYGHSLNKSLKRAGITSAIKELWQLAQHRTNWRKFYAKAEFAPSRQSWIFLFPSLYVFSHFRPFESLNVQCPAMQTHLHSKLHVIWILFGKVSYYYFIINCLVPLGNIVFLGHEKQDQTHLVKPWCLFGTTSVVFSLRTHHKIIQICTQINVWVVDDSNQKSVFSISMKALSPYNR